MKRPEILDQPEKIREIDRLKMSGLLNDFPKQIEEAVRIGKDFSSPASLAGGVEKIVFFGMGGSAIGGDVIKSLLFPDSVLPIFVSRHYDVPPFVDSKTLGIFSSYSGNTEETLAAFRQGVKRGAKSVVITSGGELARLARESSIPCIKIPSGFPPRAALGYSVFPLLNLLSNLKLCSWDPRAVEETLSLLKSDAKKYSPDVPAAKNPAKRLARELSGRFVMIYAGPDLLDSAALRFRNQIEENAKAMASHHIIPEMNHNEILGWQFPRDVLKKCAAVFLEDSGDHVRIKLRVKITKKLIAKDGVSIQSIVSRGESRLARLFSTIYHGDWISFYLALLYGIDPTPVAVIESLKKQLAQVPF